jgi:hypothetical protein
MSSFGGSRSPSAAQAVRLSEETEAAFGLLRVEPLDVGQVLDPSRADASGPSGNGVARKSGGPWRRVDVPISELLVETMSSPRTVGPQDGESNSRLSLAAMDLLQDGTRDPFAPSVRSSRDRGHAAHELCALRKGVRDAKHERLPEQMTAFLREHADVVGEALRSTTFQLDGSPGICSSERGNVDESSVRLHRGS